jgi:hypothetical protein
MQVGFDNLFIVISSFYFLLKSWNTIAVLCKCDSWNTIAVLLAVHVLVLELWGAFCQGERVLLF